MRGSWGGGGAVVFISVEIGRFPLLLTDEFALWLEGRKRPSAWHRVCESPGHVYERASRRGVDAHVKASVLPYDSCGLGFGSWQRLRLFGSKESLVDLI